MSMKDRVDKHTARAAPSVPSSPPRVLPAILLRGEAQRRPKADGPREALAAAADEAGPPQDRFGAGISKGASSSSS